MAYFNYKAIYQLLPTSIQVRSQLAVLFCLVVILYFSQSIAYIATVMAPPSPRRSSCAVPKCSSMCVSIKYSPLKQSCCQQYCKQSLCTMCIDWHTELCTTHVYNNTATTNTAQKSVVSSQELKNSFASSSSMTTKVRIWNGTYLVIM